MLWLFETGSHFVALAGLEPVTLSPQHPALWGYRHVLEVWQALVIVFFSPFREPAAAEALGWDLKCRSFILWPGDIRLSLSIPSISVVICCNFSWRHELQNADAVAAALNI